MIIFDASYLVVLLHPAPAPAKDRADKPVTQFKERVAYLASTLDVTNDVIGIPTPAMAEVLVRAGSARAKYMTTLSDTGKFSILPFDSRAAIEAAELIARVKAEQKSQPWETWAKVKFDVQISAIAKAESATVIYSDDQDIENHGKRLKIKVVRICDLPLPPPEVVAPPDTGPVGAQKMLPLVPQEDKTAAPPLEGQANAANAEARTVEENNELEADPAHPAAVSGSDEGRAQGEAAGEGKKELAKEVATRQPCECGCGEFPKDPKSRFLPGHDLRKAYNDQKQPPQ